MGVDEQAQHEIDQQYAYYCAEILAHELSQDHDVDPPAHLLSEQVAGGGGGGLMQSVPPRCLPQILIEVDDDGRETVLGPVMSGPDESGGFAEGEDEDEEAEVEMMLRDKISPSS
jgi:hypothetical protein